MKLVELSEKQNDVKRTVDDFIAEFKDLEKFECLVILATFKDGGQVLRTNNSSAYQKAFLLQFFQAWFHSWFNIKQD